MGSSGTHLCRAWFPASRMHADGANARALAVTRGVLARVAERTRENETGRVRAALRARASVAGPGGGSARNRRGRKPVHGLPRETVNYRRA